MDNSMFGSLRQAPSPGLEVPTAPLGLAWPRSDDKPRPQLSPHGTDNELEEKSCGRAFQHCEGSLSQNRELTD